MKTSVFPSAGQLTGLAAAFLLTLGCTGEAGRQGVAGPTGTQGPAGQPGEPGASGELDPSLSTWDKAVAGIGGQAALDGLTGFSVEASGVRSLGGEGYRHDDAEANTDFFDITTHMDMASMGLRVDWARSILLFGGAPLNYSEIVSGDLGYVEGDDSIFGPAASTTDMPSARWAAVFKQAMLTHPPALLAMVNADPTMATDGGVTLFNGAIHELLVIQDDVHPITLFINAATGRIAKLSTVENDHLHRDVPLEVHFHDWMNDMDGGVAFPMSVYLTVNGQIWHEEYRTTITQNPAFTTEFDFPGGANPVYDEDAAMWGARSHQFLQGFNSLGITQNFEQLTIIPDMLNNGVYFLGGSSHNSMAIEQDDGVVIVEAPLYPERSEAILAWVAATFGGKPVTNLVITHHHTDHSAGFRAFVAAGARLIVGEESAEFYRHLAQAPSTIVPDNQSMMPREVNIIALAEGESHVILGAEPFAPGAANGKKAGESGEIGEKGVFGDLTILHMRSGHSDDMLITHVSTGDGYVFQSDLFNPDGMGGFALSAPFAQELLDAINDAGWNVPDATLVGGHGLYAPITELENFLAPPP